MILNPFYKLILSKILQYIMAISAGLMIALETSIPFFTPCFIVVLIDVYAAWALGRRVHKKYPDKADGKFKSVYKFRIMSTMLLILLVIIAANNVDMYVIKNSDLIAVRFCVGTFIGYEGWGILENWSSENNNKIAKALQRIMVNKAERHFNVPLKDIMLKDDNNLNNKEEKQDEKE